MNINLPELTDTERKKAKENLGLKIMAVFLSGITLILVNFIILEISSKNDSIKDFFYGAKGPSGGEDTTVYFTILMGGLALIFIYIYYVSGKKIKSVIHKNKSRD